MDIVAWLRELRLLASNADWNATIVNNRFDEAAGEIERLREEIADLKYKKTYLERAYMAARKTLDSKGIHMDYFLSRADYEAELKEGE